MHDDLRTLVFGMQLSDHFSNDPARLGGDVGEV